MNYADRLELAICSIDGAAPQIKEAFDSSDIAKFYGCSGAAARDAINELLKKNKIAVHSTKGRWNKYIATREKPRDTTVESLCTEIIENVGNSLYGVLGGALRQVALRQLKECTDIELAEELLSRFLKREVK